MTTLEIKDLHVSVDNPSDGGEIAILNGVNLTVSSGETHALMGPNGSGKSTLSYAIAGHPKYRVTSGSITLDGENVLEMSVDERARAGIFLAMQYPVEVPGVSVSNFLRSAATAVRGEAPKLRHWVKEVKAAMGSLEIDPVFAERNVNEGFSGGEKKRHEILQLELQDLVALLLATGETLVDVALGEDRVDFQRAHRRLDLFDPVPQLRGLAAHGGCRRAQEVRHRDAGHLDRVLHGQKDAGPRP